VAFARPLALAIVSAAALTGCGGGGSNAPTDPEDVIRAWSVALESGDGVRAASYFTVPAIVQNNTPPIELKTRAEVVFFNLTLPCGGKVVRTSQRGPYTDVIFVLTNRTGGDCGTGTGHEAATAFLVRDGKIAEWRRLPDPQAPKPSTVTGPRA
jgi:hypothetical protein